jgi:hypothetical protein
MLSCTFIFTGRRARGRIDEKNKRWEMRMRSAERGEVDRKREFNGRNSTQHQGCEYFLCSGVTWFEGPSRRAQRRAFESGS